MKYIFTVVSILFFSTLFSQNIAIGKICATDTKEALPFATVAVYKNGVLLTGTESDINGEYKIDLAESGKYDFEFYYTGYAPQKKKGIILKENYATVLNRKLIQEKHHCPSGRYKYPLIELDNTTQGFIFSSTQIRNMPHRGN